MKKPVLYIQLIGCEGPGLIDEALPKSIQRTVCRPAVGQPLPGNPSDYTAVVCLGGPMGVYETGKHPWIEGLIAFMAEAIRQEAPCLGICFGSQILATAAGAAVAPSGVKEIGWEKILLTEEGREDPILSTLPPEIEVFHWHGDRWEIPEGAVLLASSERCGHQVFRLNDLHYGFQCHLEILEDDPACWADAYADELASDPSLPSRKSLIESTRLFHPILAPLAERMFRNFWELVQV